MTIGDRDHTAEQIISQNEQKRWDANLHAIKELGPYYDAALNSAVFNGDTKKLTQEALRQLEALEAKGTQLRKDNRIITGLFDLTKFGLLKGHIEERKKEFNLENEVELAERNLEAAREKLKQYQRMQDARVHAMKELNFYFQDAVEALGSSEKVAEEARRQLDELEAQGIPTRDKSGLVTIGLLDLEKLGLSKEVAEKRAQQIQDIKGQKPKEIIKGGGGTVGVDGKVLPHAHGASFGLNG